MVYVKDPDYYKKGRGKEAAAIRKRVIKLLKQRGYIYHLRKDGSIVKYFDIRRHMKEPEFIDKITKRKRKGIRLRPFTSDDDFNLHIKITERDRIITCTYYRENGNRNLEIEVYIMDSQEYRDGETYTFTFAVPSNLSKILEEIREIAIQLVTRFRIAYLFDNPLHKGHPLYYLYKTKKVVVGDKKRKKTVYLYNLPHYNYFRNYETRLDEDLKIRTVLIRPTTHDFTGVSVNIYEGNKIGTPAVYFGGRRAATIVPIVKKKRILSDGSVKYYRGGVGAAAFKLFVYKYMEVTPYSKYQRKKIEKVYEETTKKIKERLGPLVEYALKRREEIRRNFYV